MRIELCASNAAQTALVVSLLTLGSSPPGLAAAGLAAGHASHGPAEAAEKSLGVVDFQVSCTSAVRSDFDRAIGLLHHMMYVEAQAAFEEIAKKDPQCAMAHWGIATTLFQPLWPTRPSPEDLARGWAEVQQASKATTLTDREQNLVGATAAFFRDPGELDWWNRLRRWAEAMTRAYEAHPEHFETAAFYALSQLAIAPVSEDRGARNETAAKVLLAIHEKEPRHPGAAHYTIHANDVDGRANESLEIVRSYDGIAPGVPHALHMPTHIFVRLGAWPDVIEWNRKSADAALRFPAGKATSHHYLHATDYLLYAFLQRGEDAKAKSVLDEVRRHESFQPSFMSAFHLAAMPARHAIERRAWAEAAEVEPQTPSDLPWDKAVWAEALSWLARGLGAVHTGASDEARSAEARMVTLRGTAKSAGEEDFARYIEIDRLILSAAIAQSEKRSDDAVAQLQTAVAMEREVEKHAVTPGSPLPPGEALGELLLELGRPADALAAYEASNGIWPRRYNTLLGAARAAAAAGRTEAAAAYYADLLESTDPASDRAGTLEARTFVGARKS